MKKSYLFIILLIIVMFLSISPAGADYILDSEGNYSWTVSTPEEFHKAVTDSQKDDSTGSFVITLGADIDIPESSSIKFDKNTVTILGNGYTLDFGLSHILIENDAVLNLGKEEYDKSLTILCGEQNKLCQLDGGELHIYENVDIKPSSDKIVYPQPIIDVIGSKAAAYMHGGSISGFSGQGGGYVAPIIRVESTFVLDGGSISENTNLCGYGAVYVCSGGTFTMNDGTISRNTISGTIDTSGDPSITYAGGGVFVQKDGIFTMTGGTISGNTVNTVNPEKTIYAGGGVFVFDGIFTMTGGSITENSASPAGGVYVSTGRHIYMSGKVVVKGNTKSDGNTASNVYLSSNGFGGIQYIFLKGPIESEDNSVGVTTEILPDETTSVRFTTEEKSYPKDWLGNAWYDESKYKFFSDNPTYSVKPQDINTPSDYFNTGLELYLLTGFTVSFDANKGTGTMNPVTEISGDYTLPVCTFSPPGGYTFKGWAMSPESEIIETSSITVDKDIKLYAIWSPIPYNIQYKELYGTTHNNPDTYTIEDTVILGNPTSKRIGHTFIGWLDESSNPSTGIPVGKTGHRTFTATWGVNTTAITLDANGGSENPQQVTATYDSQNLTPDITTPTRTGYTFEGWYIGGTKVIDGYGTLTSGAQGYTNETGHWKYDGASPLTLTATWTPVQYGITYELNGGTVDPENLASYTIETETFKLTNPTKNGYTFEGWTGTGLSAVTKDVTITKGSTGACSYTASWTVNQYTITFDTAGGTLIDPITQDFGTPVEKPANPTKTGYTFNGWDKKVPATMPAEDMIITATWTIIPPADPPKGSSIWLTETPTPTPTETPTETPTPGDDEPVTPPGDDTKKGNLLWHIISMILLKLLIFWFIILLFFRKTVTFIVHTASGVEKYKVKCWYGRYVNQEKLPELLRNVTWYRDPERTEIFDINEERIRKSIKVYLE